MFSLHAPASKDQRLQIQDGSIHWTRNRRIRETRTPSATASDTSEELMAHTHRLGLLLAPQQLGSWIQAED
jgi:hypothetical protein